ncbi:MAG TPA: nuclear transport factor 2 family protein [Solirubrobacteraceae bacterium]
MSVTPRADMEERARELVVRFYTAFGRRDHATMTAAYAPDAHFHDPAFGDVDGRRIGAMWRMLAEAATDLEVEYRDVTASGDTAAATWVAAYTFSQTGRRVVNVVHAHFTIVDRLIVSHVDQFDMWRWTRQALGPVGTMLGWSPLLRMATRRKANALLDAFVASHDLDGGSSSPSG